VKTLFLNPPSYEGFDGGAGSRYQARREVRSFWYPTWLAQAASLLPDSTLVDAPPDDVTIEQVVERARGHELIVIHTSTPSVVSDARTAEHLKRELPGVTIGFVGAHTMVLPEETLALAGGRLWPPTVSSITGARSRGSAAERIGGIPIAPRGSFERTASRPPIRPRRLPVRRRRLPAPPGRAVLIGYHNTVRVALHRRGCRSRCTPASGADDRGPHLSHPQSKRRRRDGAGEVVPGASFFDDDTFTDDWPRAEDIARGPASSASPGRATPRRTCPGR
jgi:hypothetical protein